MKARLVLFECKKKIRRQLNGGTVRNLAVKKAEKAGTPKPVPELSVAVQDVSRGKKQVTKNKQAAIEAVAQE